MYAFGSSAVACGAARYVTASMKRRPLAARAARDGLARRLVDGEHVAAVDARARNPVAGGLVDERLGPRLRGERRRDRPLVVVAEEDERRAHHGREVGALVERALGGGAVAEEGRARRRSRPSAACPRRARRRAAHASRSGRRSRRGCSRPGSTSRRDGRATTRGSSPPASRAAARSRTRGSSGRSSPRRRARGTRPPGSPRGPRRSRTCRSGPGCGRRPSARRRCAAAPSSGRARAAPARRAPRPRRPGPSRRRRSRGGGRAPRASCSPSGAALDTLLERKRERPREHGIAACEEVGGGRLDRHVDRRLGTLSPGGPNSRYDGRDAQRQSGLLERERRSSLPTGSARRRPARRRASRSSALDVGDEVSRRRERRPGR